MTFVKIATGVELKLADGSTIKGYEKAAIFLRGEGANECRWKGELGIPRPVWEEHGQKLSVGTEYKVVLFAQGKTWNDVLRITGLPEDVEGDYVCVECCGPDA